MHHGDSPTFANLHMERSKRSTIRLYLKWVLWVLLAQTILVNISAAIYAYKFTHFFSEPKTTSTSHNLLYKTWKLFVGPTFYKDAIEPEPPFPYHAVTLQTKDNIAIDGWYSQTDTSTKCVIFFHGISVNKSYVVKEASMFRSWGYNVLLIDFRAHGKSGGSNSTFGMKETDETAEAFEYAKFRGNKRIILYGVSLGAGVSLRAAACGMVHPDAIIADMPFGSLHLHLKSRAEVLGFPSEPFATLVTFWIGMERGYNAFRHNIDAYAKDVHCPVLVEWGEKDRYVKRNEITNVFKNLGSSKKKLVVYPNADHESFLQVDPITWQKSMKDFLSAL